MALVMNFIETDVKTKDFFIIHRNVLVITEFVFNFLPICCIGATHASGAFFGDFLFIMYIRWVQISDGIL